MLHNHDNKNRPSDFLVEHIGLLPVGRVLDIAMGNGRNIIYLAKLGFTVEGVDISSEAINEAVLLAKNEGINIKVTIADLEGDYHIERDAYDIIICFNYLQRSLIPQIRKGLKIGGMVVYETFIIDQVRFGKPNNPDYLLKHNELLGMFRDFRCLRYREGIIGDSKAVAGIVAEKV